MTSDPKNFIKNYSKLLHDEFNRASGIKAVHLSIWNEIAQGFNL